MPLINNDKWGRRVARIGDALPVVAFVLIAVAVAAGLAAFIVLR